MKIYSVSEIEKHFKIPAKKVYFLIKNDLLEAGTRNGRLFVTEKEIKRYLGLPKDKIEAYQSSFLKSLGPGIITGAADDDPSGVVAYSTVGSTYGLALSWLALYLLPLMSAVQETCARIGIVTGKGLASAIDRKYGKKILAALTILLVIANTINIGADIGAMSSSSQLLVPGLNFYFGVIVITIVMLFLVINFSYHQYAKILKWLTLSLFAYIFTAIIIHPNWEAVVKSLAIPQIHLTMPYFAAIVAFLGTTISPYLFFWQTSQEVEEKIDNKTLSEHHIIALKGQIKAMRKDTYVGMFYSNFVALFIVITTAFVLFNHGINNINTAAQAALALKPLAGSLAYLLFTVGIVGIGLLAVPVLAGASAYAMSEVFNWNEGLRTRYKGARGFYDVIIFSMVIGMIINFVGINPIKGLYYAAVINGIVAPILLYFIFKIGNDKKIMGSFKTPKLINFFGWLATILMGICAVILITLIISGMVK